MKIEGTLPKADGYRMPGEFEEHEGCYIIWPERTDNWRLGAKPAQACFTEVATAISAFEPVTVLVSAQQYENARSMLPEQIRTVEMSSNDSWIRDFGPTYVINEEGKLRGIDWRFNAWGGLFDGLYFPWDKDDQVAQKVCWLENIDFYHLENFILEGCSIHVDGEGTLITTEECLLSEGRNRELSKEQIESVLKQYCNVEKVIWLKRGLYLDETNGHIDNILNFVKPGEVILSWSDDPNDPHYKIARECEFILKNVSDAKNRSFTIHKIHCPSPVLITKEESEGVDAVNGTFPRQPGDRLAASYVNYYTANGAIIFPLFDDPKDKDAQALLEKVYPDRQVIGVQAREILLGGGNIHCMTQHVPRRTK